MSNVHRLNDYESNSPPQRRGSRMSSALPFMSGVGGSGDPRKETVCDMLRYTCCPQLKLKSFIAIITIVDIVMFIIVLAVGGSPHGSALTPVAFLAPNPDTLWYFGEKDPYAMRYQFQLWRFITPVFLHAGLAHILTNVFSQLIFGSMIEAMIGFWKTAMIYFACAIGGNLFSALVSDSPSVGASTAIAGLLGVYVGYIIVSWKAMDYPGSPRWQMVCFVTLIIVLNILIGTSSDGISYVDNYGHFGGLITGITISMFTVKAMNGRYQSYEKKVEWVGRIATAIYFVLCFTLFYTIRHPPAIAH